IGKGRTVMTVRAMIRPQTAEPDLWYLFAPIKKARLDYMVEKATELGVSLIQPVITAHTNPCRIKMDKIRQNAMLAAGQCELMTVPRVEPVIGLEPLLAAWPGDRLLMFCDEGGAHDQNTFPVAKAIDEVRAWQERPRKWAILIGPEGGFSPSERRLIRQQANVVPVTLGPRILRADTAAIVAIALWQAVAGDGQDGDGRDKA
ncbi:MAG: 16S rRNA (uracil(1498)-N(3))-methyltransferase, partial [Alphaproteobacteria bacterium]|nr:16S rRNA (uracil(1498)-N(3))-methyltransferase [Alphaproteobacteria bacterium]